MIEKKAALGLENYPLEFGTETDDFLVKNDFATLKSDLAVEITGDWRDFDISHQHYFYAKNFPTDSNAKIIDEFYEKVYMAVAQKCNESQEYTIDCFNERYTCRKMADIEQIHYEAMTDEEKAAYDLEKKKNAINNRRYERDELLKTVVDPIVTNPLRWEALTEEEKQNYKNYRQYLLDVPQQNNFPDEEILSLEDFLLAQNKETFTESE